MGDARCPFCDPVPEIAGNELAFAVRDRFPVSEGHTLVVSRRHLPDWWAATPQEQKALLSLVDNVRADLDSGVPRPHGYNVGFNAGAAAGQTVPHLHVHVIPSYDGDVPDPRGGIRHVIPGRGNYVTGSVPALRRGPEVPLGPSLADCLADRRLDRVDIAVSFVMRSGLEELDVELSAALTRPDTQVRLLTTDYLGITEKSALQRLLITSQEHDHALQVRVFQDAGTSFHPKAYLFYASGSRPLGFGFIGSANLSRGGLRTGVEWSLLTSDPIELDELRHGFEALWADERSAPLTRELIDGYVQSPRVAAPGTVGSIDATGVPESTPDALPTPIQLQALTALEQTRAAGFGAGLVVLATGLGKTWLAAFDSARPTYRRVLFLAHREEILRQSQAVFRRVEPSRSTGLLVADIDQGDADVVFASVQTFSRRLRRFKPDAFDYVVVDEFHHAAAPTYRRILGHLAPRFLLGLTATPDRTDAADLLALCDDNLVFEVGIGEGIDRDALCPFAYVGVPDTIDFAPIPWRNGRFDPQALESAAVTAERTSAALREWRAHAGTRTLAFCVSVRHAEHMASAFRAEGVRAVAVHASPGSAPRHQSLDALARGDLDVVFSVNLFNEGVDVPAIDSVLMLRPTESPVLFLQQLGRGLRPHPDKDQLRVVDFVGNHRSFLMKPRVLLSLTGRAATDQDLRRALESGRFVLPEGCTVDYGLTALDLLRRLAASSRGATRLRDWVVEYVAETGRRPTAVQAQRADLNPAAANKDGGWFAVLDAEAALREAEARALLQHGDLLRALAVEPMTKSYKMVALRALLLSDRLVDGLPVDELSGLSHRLVCRDPRLLRDTASRAMPEPAAVTSAEWATFWRSWPIAAWLGELSGAGERWFRLDGDRFRLSHDVDPDLRDTLTAMAAELVDWRLARYLDTKGLTRAGAAVLKVSHAGGRPILFLNRDKNPPLPQERDIEVEADGRAYRMDFVTVAINVAHLAEEPGNALPDLLWNWFGPDAGQPGTDHRVTVEIDADGRWHMRPNHRDPADRAEFPA